MDELTSVAQLFKNLYAYNDLCFEKKKNSLLFDNSNIVYKISQSIVVVVYMNTLDLNLICKKDVSR